VVVESGVQRGDVLALRDPTRPAGEPAVKPAAPPPASPATRSGAMRRVTIIVQ